MATDFGDESGEKLFDWILRIGQNAGEQAMFASAEKLKGAFRKARGEAASRHGEATAEQPAEWAKLSMEQFAALPEYQSLKEVIDEKLSRDGLEHAFFEDQGKEHLLFRVEDAPDVSRAFADLEKQTDEAYGKALKARGRTREQVRDSQPLDERAAQVREASKTLEASHGKEREIGKAARSK